MAWNFDGTRFKIIRRYLCKTIYRGRRFKGIGWYAQIGAGKGDRTRVYLISKKFKLKNFENIWDNVSLKIDWSGECIG